MNVNAKRKRIIELAKYCKLLKIMREHKMNDNNETYTSLKEIIYKEAKKLNWTNHVREFLHN